MANLTMALGPALNETQELVEEATGACLLPGASTFFNPCASPGLACLAATPAPVCAALLCMLGMLRCAALCWNARGGGS